VLVLVPVLVPVFVPVLVPVVLPPLLVWSPFFAVALESPPSP
jgi:hypothetical protein